MACIFCQIAAHTAPASVIHEDADLLAFMTLHPTAPGECLIIPRAHIDHFTDIPDPLAEAIMRLAIRLGRRMRAVFRPERVGFLVHGYGIPHAHLILIPQHGPHHITSDRFAEIVDGEIRFTLTRVGTADRATLDAHASLLARPLPSEQAG